MRFNKTVDAFTGKIRLEKMKYTDSIRSQEDAINATRSGQYIIGSVTSSGHVSFSINPATHSDVSTVRAECKRLAQVNPGKLFVFVKLAGAELLPATSISI